MEASESKKTLGLIEMLSKQIEYALDNKTEIVVIVEHYRNNETVANTNFGADFSKETRRPMVITFSSVEPCSIREKMAIGEKLHEYLNCFNQSGKTNKE